MCWSFQPLKFLQTMPKVTREVKFESSAPGLERRYSEKCLPQVILAKRLSLLLPCRSDSKDHKSPASCPSLEFGNHVYQVKTPEKLGQINKVATATFRKGNV